MRILVCGGRDFDDEYWVARVLDEYREKLKGDIVIIHGGATGADKLADEWATAHNVETVVFPADWHGLGRAAGPIRNQQMIDEGKPDLVIAFPGGRGTHDMERRAYAARLQVRAERYYAAG